MALSKKSLQRKREKKKNREISYKNWSIHECWVSINIWENGMGQVIISRKNTQDDIAVGAYLIDTYCLGIKDCFVLFMNTYDYQNFLDYVMELCGEMELVEPSYAKTLIIKAAEYAKQAGLKPHSDFVKARNFLRGIPLDKTEIFNFGKDGKPFYIQESHESTADVKRVLKTLWSNQSNENDHFLIKAPYPNQLIENEMCEMT
jgi:hypothetical protein